MSNQTDSLKQVAQLRKAVMPLVELLRAETNQDLTKRLDVIESSLVELAKRDMNVEVKAPEVSVNVETPPALTQAIEKMVEVQLKKASPAIPLPQPNYQPHDQGGSNGIKYNGFAAPEGFWYIQRTAKGQQRYASGKSDYSKAWAKKGSLSYGNIDGSK